MSVADDVQQLRATVDNVRRVAAQRPDVVVDRHLIAELISEQHLMLGPAAREAFIGDVLDETMGAGPLAPLLRLPGVTDVLVNGPDRIYVDSGPGLQQVDVSFENDQAVRECAQRLARSANRRLDDAHPFVDARLPTGERLHAVLPPVSRAGTLISIRVPARLGLSWEQIIESSAIGSREQQALLEAVRNRDSILITGGTGSGKTTLMSALLEQCGPDDRIVIVEDTSELVPAHPHVLRLECRPANAEGAGAVTMSTLVRQSLRMRPDRIVVGEVRGAEVEDLLRALNTGHTGSMATLHANRPADVPVRIEVLAASCGISADGLHAALAAAFALVVHMQRGADGRRRIGAMARLQLHQRRVQVLEC
ncbi:MAG: TadA family conjugal transfer-associated ATPase [Actinobacteria bacterium]|jgi:pilus assembly protein CpaF|nr:TadA family conjugal transfer-associated ATPase [Actinomycetota bacterium]